MLTTQRIENTRALYSNQDRRSKKMKVLICGSRGISDPATVLAAVEQSGMSPTPLSPAEQEVLTGWRARMQPHEASSSRNIRLIGISTVNVRALFATTRWSEQPTQSSRCGTAQVPEQSIRSSLPDLAGNGFSFT